MTDHPWQWLTTELDQLDAAGLRRQRGVRGGGQDARIRWRGKSLINFGSNDYLGLASELAGAARAASEVAGWGAGASPLVTGRGEWHERLELELADFEGTPGAVVFPTGFAANLGVVSALAGRGDLILSDAKNHASLIDGCRLSGARVHVYPHVDCDYLEKLLAQGAQFRRRWIVTDSLFSMDGDFAPLDRIVDLAERYDALAIVDEAHATGVYGERGRGWCEELGVESPRVVRVGTFSKALGTLGGFAVGAGPAMEWLANRARSYVYSTAAPEALAATALAALEIVRREPQRRRELRRRAVELRQRLAALGWDTLRSDSQIIPLIVGSADRAVRLQRRLEERGFFAPGIRPPTVPENEALVRISLTYRHTPDMIDQFVAAIAESSEGR